MPSPGPRAALAAALLLYAPAADAQQRTGPTTYATVSTDRFRLLVTAEARRDSTVLVVIDSAGHSPRASFTLSAATAREWAETLQKIVNVVRDSAGTRRLAEFDPATSALALLAAREQPDDAKGAVLLVVEGTDGTGGPELRVRPDDVRAFARGLRRAADGAPAVEPGLAYFEFQVSKPVSVARPSCHPAYPESLRNRLVTGEAQLQFVVDAEGRVERETVRVLSATHNEFADAVRAALPCMRFVPAELHGAKVRQIVQQPFVFDISR